jgi:hypothetical protein
MGAGPDRTLLPKCGEGESRTQPGTGSQRALRAEIAGQHVISAKPRPDFGLPTVHTDS